MTLLGHCCVLIKGDKSLSTVFFPYCKFNCLQCSSTYSRLTVYLLLRTCFTFNQLLSSLISGADQRTAR